MRAKWWMPLTQISEGPYPKAAEAPVLANPSTPRWSQSGTGPLPTVAEATASPKRREALPESAVDPKFANVGVRPVCTKQRRLQHSQSNRSPCSEAVQALVLLKRQRTLRLSGEGPGVTKAAEALALPKQPSPVPQSGKGPGEPRAAEAPAFPRRRGPPLSQSDGGPCPKAAKAFGTKRRRPRSSQCDRGSCPKTTEAVEFPKQ